MQKLIFILGLLICSPVILPLSSCSDSHRTEMGLLDSLDLLLDEATEAIQLDGSLFTARIDELQRQRFDIQQHYSDSMSLELGQLMDKHRAITKRYMRAETELTALTKECSSLQKQVSDLRNYVRSKDYEKETFKGYFRNERKDVRHAHERALALNKEIYEIEPTYMRVSDSVQEIINGFPKP